MLQPQEAVLVCVSGGKDSLVLWSVLHELGYKTKAMYIDLGLGEYSLLSKQNVLDMAKKMSQEPVVVSLKDMGFDIMAVAKAKHRPACSVCGTAKRYHFNRAAFKEGLQVVATGHNLDDEASRLLGNVLRWQTNYLAKQSPVLPSESEHTPKKVKPLVKLTEREVAVFAFLEGIDYILEECPYAKGATSITYKLLLGQLEEKMPGTKHAFYFGFQEHLSKFSQAEAPKGELKTCEVCGQDSFEETCGFCRLLGQLSP
jgi:uncharacterized protein (TIGR00269 family)